ncbi:hypothetical protein PV08_04618 [Exophiala spinifera]|uniref:EthD domain-containing protein n=1 Tax=Exophiala spinifera TaxID=91928 RepID=A0A0D2C161_9EURO|nr:uncharacterized protein PV08_04618 [Exophiala spinifera]KIW17424.1 hypothetical protein PV08_04618 [Exophiala spinifera]
MGYQFQVLYPNDEGSSFNLDYYVNKHMPMVMERWGKFGLKGYTVTEYKPGADGAKPKYSAAGFLFWDTAEDLQAALASQEDLTAIFADVPNYANVEPVVLSGPVVGSK